MQYAAYITRAEHWSFENRERSPISRSEWLAHVKGDQELELMKFVGCKQPQTGKVVLVAVCDTYEWIAHPMRSGRQSPATFEFNRGGVIVRCPDADLLRKALQIAAALSANVIGDDDRVLGEDRLFD